MATKPPAKKAAAKKAAPKSATKPAKKKAAKKAVAKKAAKPAKKSAKPAAKKAAAKQKPESPAEKKQEQPKGKLSAVNKALQDLLTDHPILMEFHFISDPVKKQEKIGDLKAAISAAAAKVVPALAELMTDPTADDISVMSMETRLSAQMYLMGLPEFARRAISDDVRHIEVTVQNYLRYKARPFADSLLTSMIEGNTPQKKSPNVYV